MTNSKSTHPGAESQPDLEMLAKEFMSMKQSISEIMAKSESEGGNGVAGALHTATQDVKDRVSHLHEDISAQGKRAVSALSEQIEERPFASLLIAFAVGFAVSKLMSRST
jgi:ElaB/YqjD/DUF883 family membrane-anchored ribosome-binding protein